MLCLSYHALTRIFGVQVLFFSCKWHVNHGSGVNSPNLHNSKSYYFREGMAGFIFVQEETPPEPQDLSAGAMLMSYSLLNVPIKALQPRCISGQCHISKQQYLSTTSFGGREDQETMKKSNHQAGLCGQWEGAGMNADRLGNSTGIGENISATKFKVN